VIRSVLKQIIIIHAEDGHYKKKNININVYKYTEMSKKYTEMSKKYTEMSKKYTEMSKNIEKYNYILILE